MYQVLRSAPQIKPADAQLLLRDMYETVFGIYNHETAPPDREMAIIAMHPAEDAHTDSALYERIEQYGRYEIKEHYGVSLTELLQMPRDLVLKIFEECEKISKKKSQQATQFLSQAGGGGKP